MDRGMVREGGRMYDRDVVELALLALEEGMSMVGEKKVIPAVIVQDF